MMDTLILLSSDTISHDDLTAFLTEIGAVIKPDEVSDGRLSRGWCHLWISLSPETLAAMREDDKRLCNAATEKLGSAPRSCVDADVSRAVGSDRLALEFSIAFTERWHAVLCDPEDRLWTLAELRRMLRNGEKLGVREE
jgi:hypothetical protein